MAIAPLPALAQIRTDGSLGHAAQSLKGPNYLIPESLGKLSGSNLFQSFETFQLDSGQSANFTTTTNGLTNVISRVTGGKVSTINGRIKLTPVDGVPNFYFINPSGVVFGLGAAVDVPGSFHVSTADYIQLGDSKFFADPARVSTFSSAPPANFGFLGATRSDIIVKEGASLNPAPGNSISLVGGDIKISGATVSATSADIRVIAVGSTAYETPMVGPMPAQTSGNILVSNRGQVLAYDSYGADKPAGNLYLSGQDISIDTGSKLLSNAIYGANNSGSIKIQAAGSLKLDNALIDAGGYSGGSAGAIRIQAGDFSMVNSGVSSASFVGNGTGGTVEIAAERNISMTNAQVSTQTLTDANAGSIVLSGGDIGIVGGYVSSLSGGGAGKAGSINLNARGTLDISSAGAITTSTMASGAAGDIAVTANNLSISGYGHIDSSSATSNAGRAGNVSLIVPGALNITEYGFIDSSTNSTFSAGTINIAAGTFALNHGGRVSSTSNFSTSSANAGNINITGDRLTFNDGGVVTTSTFSQGNGGAIVVRANNIAIDGEGINSIAYANGNAGSIDVRAKDSIAINSGGFSSNTYASGRAGSVVVQATDIVMDGAKSAISALSIAGVQPSSAQTGSIDVRAGNSLKLRNGALISIRNYANASGSALPTGNAIALSAPRLTIDAAQVTSESFGNVAAGPINVNFSDLAVLVNGASISTAANLGNGGPIQIVGAKALLLDASRVTTSVRGATGNGGNIAISADALVLKSGFVQANTAAVGASGGLVNISVSTLLASGNSLFSGGSIPLPFQPSAYGFNVIQAAAPTGLSGVINITSPVLDLSGSLHGIVAPVIDTGGLGRSPCHNLAGSSLALVGRGGPPPSARGLLDGASFVGKAPLMVGSTLGMLTTASATGFDPRGRRCL
jgi:filamentous hemagglutinin family protein